MAKVSKRRVTRPALRKAKRVLANKKKSMARKNLDTHFLRIRNTSTLTPVQGANTVNYIYQFYTLSTATGISDFVKNADWLLYSKLYDRFRINRMKVNFIPKANMMDFVNAQNNTITQIGDMVCHTALDRDGIAPSSVASLTRYASYKQYSILKPFSRSYAIKYPKNVWLDTTNPAASGDRVQDIGLYGGLTVYAENLPEAFLDVFNDPVYQVEVTYDIVFAGKTNGKLSAVLDNVGNVVGVSVTGPENIVNLAQSPRTNVRGYIQNDTRTVVGNTETIIGPNE